MNKTEFTEQLNNWMGTHDQPSDCEHCSNLGFWSGPKMSTVNAIELDIDDKRIARRVVPSPQVALLECSNCKKVTIIDEDRLLLSS